MTIIIRIIFLLWCPICQDFRANIEKNDYEFLYCLSEFCSVKNIKLSAFCSETFTKMIPIINPFLISVCRQKLKQHIFKVFGNLRCRLNKEKCGEFCSLLINGSKRYKFNLYGFIVHSKNRLFYFQIKNFRFTDSQVVYDKRCLGFKPSSNLSFTLATLPFVLL